MEKQLEKDKDSVNYIFWETKYRITQNNIIDNTPGDIIIT